MLKFCVLISSCDLYSDCWKPMFYSLKKNWPDTKFPIYLVANEKDSEDEMIKTIKVGEHLGWGSNTKKALNSIDADYVLLIQEDYFLDKQLSDDVINEHINYCIDNNIDYLRLGSPFRDSLKCNNSNYSEDPIGMKYSLCLQPSIWKKETLLKLTIEGWTGWDYERKINDYIKANHIDVKARVIHSTIANSKGFNMVHGTGIRKGIWTQGGVRFLKENGFIEELRRRKQEGKLLSMMMDVEDGSVFKLPARIMVKIIQKIK